MHVLSHFRLRTKLAILMGLSALALVASIGVAASLLRQRMIDDRIDTLRERRQHHDRRCLCRCKARSTLIGSPTSRRSSSSAMPSMRSASTMGRVTSSAWTTDGIVLAHGTAAALENKPTPVADVEWTHRPATG